MKLRCSDLARAMEGEIHGPDVTISGASIDSRSVNPAQLFVPVISQRDGHDFIPDALERGAAAYLTSAPPVGGTAIVVSDTIAALQDAGRVARSRLGGPVIGVTGSVGKTSVKDLLAGILGGRLRTAASERSFNNELGVPLTLLNAPDDAQAVIVEMGARGVGHIADLCSIARPTMGVVTLVAAVHTEVFGTIDEVARAKAELVRDLPASGTAVLNASDPRVLDMAQVTDARVVTFAGGGDVRAVGAVVDDELRTRFLLVSPWGEIDVALAVRGRHQVDNALAASAAALACGFTLEDVAAGLAMVELSPWRMELVTAPSGAVVLNDAYNANPTSVVAALESLAALPADRRVAVLGVMAELGEGSDEAHAAIGALAEQLGVRVVAVAAPAYGGEDVSSIEEAVDRLGPMGRGDAVLVKGSRVAALERLAALLISPTA